MGLTREQRARRAEAKAMVGRYLGGERRKVARELAEREAAELLHEMWDEMRREGYEYEPDIWRLLDDVSKESAKRYERGGISWQKGVKPCRR